MMKVLKDLGSGTFGSVKMVRDGMDQEFAVKISHVVKNDLKQTFRLAASMRKEHWLLKTLHRDQSAAVGRQYIVQLKHACWWNDLRFGLFMDCLSCTLREAMNQNGGAFDGPQVVRMGTQLLHALRFLATKRVIHGDLKPENLMLAPDRVVIVDFSLSGLQPSADDAPQTRVAKQIYSDPPPPAKWASVLKNDRNIVKTIGTNLVSRYYRPPEVAVAMANIAPGENALLWRQKHYTPKIDVFSLACTLVELLTDDFFLPSQSDAEHLWYMAAVLGPPPTRSHLQECHAPGAMPALRRTPMQVAFERVPSHVAACLEKMLAWDWTKERYSAARALKALTTTASLPVKEYSKKRKRA